ncbi:MAG: ribose 5-phosphate isomerase B [Anaerolineae bacterium]
MRVAVGTDHGGFPLKQTVLDTLNALGHEVVDVGAHVLDPVDDYPDYAAAVGRLVQAGVVERGILLCGSGVGVTMSANRLPGVRACLCHDTYTAAQGVAHDDMNVLCLGGRVIGPELARVLVEAFMAARFDGAERFRRRVAKMESLGG